MYSDGEENWTVWILALKKKLCVYQPQQGIERDMIVKFQKSLPYLTLKAKNPRLKPEDKDIDVSVMRGRVSISGKYRQEQKNKARSEFYYGDFEGDRTSSHFQF